MTSNQIANASNRIQERGVAESERHNQAVEEETKRHNLVTEGLAGDANRVEAERQYWDAWYKQQQVALQEEYNRWYAQWTEASGRRKLEIEAMLANIQGQKQQADEQYQQNLTRIQQTEAEIKSAMAEETARNNKVLEDLRSQQLSLDWYSNWIKEKQTEYQNSYWNASISLGNLQAIYEHQDRAANLELGYTKLTSDETIALTGYKRDLAKLEVEKMIGKAQTFNYYLQGIGNLFGATSRALSPWAFGK